MTDGLGGDRMPCVVSFAPIYPSGGSVWWQGGGFEDSLLPGGPSVYAPDVSRDSAGIVGRLLMPEKLSRLIVSFQEGVLVVEFTDRRIVDDLAICEISEQLDSLIEQRRGSMVIIDFAGVEHLSSSALGFLVSFTRKIRDGGGELKLCNVRPAIYEAFAITRLNKVLEVHDSFSSALRALEKV